MSEPVFFERGQGLSIGEIAALTGAKARGPEQGRRVFNVAAVDNAGPADLTFVDSAKFSTRLAKLRAGACLTSERFAAQLPPQVVALVSADPYRAFVIATEALFPGAVRPSSLYPRRDDAGVYIHPSARLEDNVSIDPGVVIGAGAEVGSGTAIAANAVIGPGVRIGRDCSIGPGASVVHALIGDRVILHAGCRIGQDGFGYLPEQKRMRKIPQVGRVIIQDDVEIGANSTVDRGSVRDTVIGEGTKIDNLVQIAHNVSIGRHCVLVSQTGISGSVTIEDRVMLGGQVGIADNIRIGEGTQLAARSAAMSDIPAGVRWGGVPARPVREWLRSEAMVVRMGKRDKDSET